MAVQVARLPINSAKIKNKIERIVDDPKVLAERRQRRSDVSGWMRCPAEKVARRANREEECSGRFWNRRDGRADDLENLPNPPKWAPHPFSDALLWRSFACILNSSQPFHSRY